MTRSVRLAVGVVLGVVLLMVAAVCALVSATAQAGLGLGGAPGGVTPVPALELRDPVEVSGEVLDVDEDQGTGYASMEVAFDDGAGGTEVATVDLGLIDGTPLPAAGDRVPLVHERGDPASVLRADDPLLRPPPEGDLDRDGVPDDYGRDDQRTTSGPEEGPGVLARRFGALAVGALVAALVVGVLTVAAVRRAPHEVAPAPQPYAAG